MTVINLMLGKKRGGLEQATVDYAEALRLADIPVLTVISPDAWIESALKQADLSYAPLRNAGGWDPVAAFRLLRLATRIQATAVICHGNRALRLALRALSGTIPIVAVAHNYSNDRFPKADSCLGITLEAIDALAARGISREKLFHMPNMVRLETPRPRPAFRTPPVIGSMGRFVSKKAFDLYIDALILLKQRNVPFTAVLGGEGELAAELKERAAPLGDQLKFTGWVEDKHAFFDSIDLFVLPSHHEPFGIVLIEAMAAGIPVISTDSEGPREIITPNVDALLTPKGNAAALADAIAASLSDQAATQKRAAQASETVKRYSPDAMAERLKLALTRIISDA